MKMHYENINKKLIILFIIRIIFFIILIISAIYILNWYIDNMQNKKIKEKLLEAVIVENNDNSNQNFKINFEQLKQINNDTIGWLKVRGTDIEYVVVQTKNNDYYLNHNFEKKYNKAGWIFADCKNRIDGTDKNIVIYGHNMKDNSMFATLENILKEEWYNNKENYILDFITENENQKYKIFSVYKIENENYYVKTEFQDNEFEEFIKKIKNRSIKNFNIDITKDDNILTLSTCADNSKYRVVLHAKKQVAKNK